MSKNTTDFDKDINPLLEVASNKDLDYLVDILKGTWTNSLEKEDAYKEHAPNHAMYADLIASHVRRFGGNTFSNIYRGVTDSGSVSFIGPDYHEIVCDVAKHFKVNYNKSQSVEIIEQAIFAKMLSDIMEKMTDEEKMEFLASVGVTNPTGSGPALTSMAIAVFKAGGFKSYKIMITIMHSIAKALGIKLPFKASALLAKSLKFLSGPVGIAITAAWGLMDISSPAKRITVPAVLYIGMLRAQYDNHVCESCGCQLNPSNKFCPECGSKTASPELTCD